jgi:electron transfer flavoprotein alpha subunit
MSVLVVVEHDRGTGGEATREALTFARDLGGQLGAPVEALTVGEGGSDADLVAECARFGAQAVHHVAPPWLADYAPEAWGDAVAAAVGSLAPAAVVACGTDRGNEVLAHAAAVLDLPFVANCSAVTTGVEWELTRVQWGGSLDEEARLAAAVPIVSVAHHVVDAEPVARPAAIEPVVLAVDVDESGARTMIRDRVVLSEGVTLATAPVVVGGGRGVGSAEGFAALEALAGRLGGVVGCSRAVTNNGWRPHADQVGQTGTRIAPQLYIACGISGAIQHWVGAKAAKAILAVNTDPQANMVVKADYAVIGDLHEVVPAITSALDG